MPFIRYCKVVFVGYFGHIPEQTHLKSWYIYRVLSKVCMHPKNPDNRILFLENYRFVMLGALDMFRQTHLKQENFLKSLTKVFLHLKN